MVYETNQTPPIEAAMMIVALSSPSGDDTIGLPSGSVWCVTRATKDKCKISNYFFFRVLLITRWLMLTNDGTGVGGAPGRGVNTGTGVGGKPM